MASVLNRNAITPRLPKNMSFTLPPSYFFCPPESALSESGLLAVGGVLHPFAVLDAILHGVFPWTIFCEFKQLDPTSIHNVAPVDNRTQTRPDDDSLQLSESERRALSSLADLSERTLVETRKIVHNAAKGEITTQIFQALPKRMQEASWNGLGYADLPTLAENGETLAWYSPSPRAIFELDALHIPRRAQRIMKSGKFQITFDEAFPEVMLGCASAEGRLETGSWITQEFYAAYCKLHDLGIAHSAECWRVDAATGARRLVGGAYGLAINGFFDGESMFSVESNASKIALFTLLQYLSSRKFSLFDLQVLNDHTASLGGIEIPRDEYLRRLNIALLTPTSFS